MGTGFSRRNKQTIDQRDNQAQQNTLCSSCGCENSNKVCNGIKASTSEERKPQVLNVDKERTYRTPNEGKKRFYFYPTKDEETLYVSTSQFPYTKPKAVAIRQHSAIDETVVDLDQQFSKKDEDSENFRTETYPKLNTALEEHLGVTDSNRLYHIVNDRRWSSPNVLPSSGFASQRMLPHRSIAELRRCSLNYPSLEHYDGYYSYNCHLSRRPPTPSPTAWYPARRSNDYLVASSLLAMERERDRVNVKENSRKDISNF